MGLSLEHILAIAAILAFGSTIQSAAGFGYGLFTVPTLVLLGRQPYEAMVLVSIGATVQGVAGLVVLRKHLKWGRVLAMIALASAAMPIGVLALELLIDFDPSVVRRVFGGLVLAALLLMVAYRPRPRERLPVGVMVMSMFGSGLMGGVSGMSGPPAVLWVMAHRWSSAESRATLWALFTGMTPVLLALLYARFGPPIGEASLLALALMPAALIGVLPGLWIGHRISKRHLRTLSMAILALVSIWALVAP